MEGFKDGSWRAKEGVGRAKTPAEEETGYRCLGLYMIRSDMYRIRTVK